MRAIVSVFAKDRLGIIADVTALLLEKQVNVLDLSQTIMDGIFTMVMLVDTSTSPCSFEDIHAALLEGGEKLELNISIQREDIFTAMHRI